MFYDNKNIKIILQQGNFIFLGQSRKLGTRPEVFCKKLALKSLVKFTGKHLFCSLFFNKVAGLRRFGCSFRLGYDCGLFESHMLQTRKLLGIQLKRKFSELSLHAVDTNS